MSFAPHLARLKSAIYATYTLDQIPKWITEKTFLRGRKYSFFNHEFQLKVLSDESTEVNCQKCSQIGMTEAQGRWVLGICRLFPHFSAIYTMPYSDDAEKLCKTRIDPIITESPDLQAAISKELNNSEIKKIGSSLVYFRGTQGNTQAISIPADLIVADEIDRSNQHILSQYNSRLTHSSWKLWRNFSTPTVEGYGIAEKMKFSRRMRNLCKCEFCAHWFVPDYYQQVKIPGFDDSLDTITKYMLYKIRYNEARLLCPKCGKNPSLLPKHREWVWENTDEPHAAAGYYISPFDAPAIIKPPGLIKVSTEYARISEFKNQNLGLTAQDTENTLTLDDLKKARVFSNITDTGLYAMGADLGLICRIVIGRIDLNGFFVVVHREKVNLGQFEERVRTLTQKFNCLIKVFDAQPYVETVLRMQGSDYNLYAAVFVRTHTVRTYRIADEDAEPIEGKLPVKEVKVNRTNAFDELVGHIKKNGLALQHDENEADEFDAECLDMKRIQKRNQEGDLVVSWEKSPNGNDHYFFALLYCYIAARLRATAQTTLLPTVLVSSFALTAKSQMQ